MAALLTAHELKQIADFDSIGLGRVRIAFILKRSPTTIRKALIKMRAGEALYSEHALIHNRMTAETRAKIVELGRSHCVRCIMKTHGLKDWSIRTTLAQANVAIVSCECVPRSKRGPKPGVKSGRRYSSFEDRMTPARQSMALRLIQEHDAETVARKINSALPGPKARLQDVLVVRDRCAA
jgi:hypothetical protein